jgi:uncharacterized protein YkwD
MIRYILILLLFLPLISTGQEFDEALVAKYFQVIINEYREKHDLHPITIDESLRPFAKEHSRYMSNIQAVTHGEGEFHFSKRAYRWFKKPIYMGENCVKFVLPPNKEKHTLTTNHPEFKPLMAKISEFGATEYDVAQYAFLGWKISPEHNRFMLDERIRYFYLTFDTHEWIYYCEFVASNTPVVSVN